MNKHNNVIQVIKPYKVDDTWVFDDERVGLVEEAFVEGADLIIDTLVQDIPDASKGFKLIFSEIPFPNYSIELDWIREEYEGNWYYSKEYDIEGWLCPALYKYFSEAPKKLYIKAEDI